MNTAKTINLVDNDQKETNEVYDNLQRTHDIYL